MLLSGVGRKVADCVGLFSLNQPGAIPVDTHVWDISVRDYDPSLSQYKSLTPAGRSTFYATTAIACLINCRYIIVFLFTYI